MTDDSWMTDEIRSRIREDGLYVGVDGSVKDPRAACPKMEEILAKKQRKRALKNAAAKRVLEERASRMDVIDYESERYSLCIVHESQDGVKPYYKYYRIADYVPEENENELVPAVLPSYATSPEQARVNPDYLYNPAAKSHYGERDSDFYYFQWRPDPAAPGKQLTRSWYDHEELLEIDEPREVFFPEDVSNVEDLRKALSEGIPFDGKTTGVFYIVYRREGNDLYSAIKCERKRFSFKDGLLKLPASIESARKTVLSAPRVLLEGRKVIESLHCDTSYRCVYAHLGDLEENGSVLLRPLEYFASDYVKWFVKEESIQLTKSDRKHLSQIIESAMSRPDALEQYLGAGASEAEVDRLLSSISHIVSGEEDQILELFQMALLRDEHFYRECVERAMSMGDELLDEKRRDIKAAEKALEKARDDRADLMSEIEGLKGVREQVEGEIHELETEAKDIGSRRDEIIDEVKSNIALNLGLSTVSDIARHPVQEQQLYIENAHEVGAVFSEEPLQRILAENLKRFGIASIAGQSENERSAAALGIVGALSATRYLAIPQVVSHQIADALSISLYGKTAKRITIPVGYRDSQHVVDCIASEEGVVLIDNVIDPVNEGILFPLLSNEVKPFVIVPFMSHASLSLVAREVWGRMFLPMVESLVVLPTPTRTKSFKRAAGDMGFECAEADDVLETSRSLNDELAALELPSQSLLLAATVFACMELLTEDSAGRFIAQDLLVSSSPTSQSLDAIVNWCGPDNGLVELAKKLMIDES
jgi:hypothetical protein